MGNASALPAAAAAAAARAGLSNDGVWLGYLINKSNRDSELHVCQPENEGRHDGESSAPAWLQRGLEVGRVVHWLLGRRTGTDAHAAAPDPEQARDQESRDR
jgi:hypothetical protein